MEGSHGNHYCNRITPCAKAGEKFDFALEGYAYHDMPGTQPLSDDGKVDEFEYAVGGMDICLRDDEVMDFMFDLDTLLSLCRALDTSSFRRAEVENALYNAHLKLFYDPECVPTMSSAPACAPLRRYSSSSLRAKTATQLRLWA